MVLKNNETSRKRERDQKPLLNSTTKQSYTANVRLSGLCNEQHVYPAVGRGARITEFDGM